MKFEVGQGCLSEQLGPGVFEHGKRMPQAVKSMWYMHPLCQASVYSMTIFMSEWIAKISVFCSLLLANW